MSCNRARRLLEARVLMDGENGGTLLPSSGRKHAYVLPKTDQVQHTDGFPTSIFKITGWTFSPRGFEVRKQISQQAQTHRGKKD